MRTTDAARKLQIPRATVAEAAAWITRLHGDRRSPELEDAFRIWLAAADEHARAFEAMTEVWDMVPGPCAAQVPRVRIWGRRQRRKRPWVPFTAAAILCAAVTIGAFRFWPISSYTTEVGEQRIVSLKDGTRVSMNSGTTLSVAYSERERRIVLKEGEAFFEVAHNARVPFNVIAGDHRVTAVGTAFAVRQEADRTSVTLVEGAVTVQSVSPERPIPTPSRSATHDDKGGSTAQDIAAAPPIALTAGQRLVFAAAESPKIDAPRLDALVAWRHGELIFDNTLLADAVAEVNRYDRTPIVIAEPRIAALPVSGVYRTGDTMGFAHIVARMYALTVVEEDDRVRLAEEKTH